jgi:hypothetical protein
MTEKKKRGAPKGHPPYPGCEKGGAYGGLAWVKLKYTDDDIKMLGEMLIEYMMQPKALWLKGFYLQLGLSRRQFDYIKENYPAFEDYFSRAKEMQETKLVEKSFWKEADGRFAQFILCGFHEDFKPDMAVVEQTDNVFQVNYYKARESDGSAKQVLPQAVPTTDSGSS